MWSLKLLLFSLCHQIESQITFTSTERTKYLAVVGWNVDCKKTQLIVICTKRRERLWVRGQKILVSNIIEYVPFIIQQVFQIIYQVPNIIEQVPNSLQKIIRWPMVCSHAWTKIRTPVNLCRCKSNRYLTSYKRCVLSFNNCQASLKRTKQFTKVNQMSDGVQPSLNKDQNSGELVSVNLTGP
jgi:hypothetical protein